MNQPPNFTFISLLLCAGGRLFCREFRSATAYWPEVMLPAEPVGFYRKKMVRKGSYPRRCLSIFCVVVLFMEVFWFPAVSPAQDSPQEKKTVVTVPFTPIAVSIPSWQLSYRPRKRPGIWLGDNFFIEYPAVGAGLKYEFRDEIRENDGEKTSELYHEFSQRVGFRSTGWIYNPALCNFSAILEPEFSQVYEEDSDGRTNSGNLFSPDYILTARFLELKPYTLDLHAKRREQPLWSPFRGGVENLVYDFGGAVDFDFRRMLKTSDAYNAKLKYNHIDSTIDGFYSQSEISENFYFDSTQRGKKLTTGLSSFYVDSYRLTDEVETTLKTFNVQFVNNYLIRQGNPITLDGILDYRFQDYETVDLQTFRINERLNWRHRNNLTSFYQFNYNFQDTDRSDATNRLALEGWVRHTLFDNLTTSTGLRTAYIDYSNGDEMNVEPHLRFRYIRPTPIGFISLDTGWKYLLTTRNFDNSQSGIVVQGEPHALSYSQDSFLRKYNVSPESIIVTNADGTIQYVEGLDYQVEVIGDYVSIRSLSLGSINNGEDVVVNYVYQQDSSFDDAIFSQNYNLAYTFLDNTTFQVSHSDSKQHVIEGNTPSVLADRSVNSTSVHHRMGWSDTRLEMAWYERPSDLDYQRWQATQRFTIRPLRVLNLSVSGYYGQREYTDQPLDEGVRYDSDFFGGTIRANWRISRRLRFNIEGFTNNWEDEVETTVNTGMRAGFIYTYRIWTARLSWQLTDQGFDTVESDSSRTRNYVRFDLVRLYW